jgi:putative membrane protein
MQSDPHEIGAAGSPGGDAPPVDVQTHFAWLRTRMSEERTLMSWNRISLTLVSLGFTIYQWFEKAQQGATDHPEATRGLAVAFILGGTIAALTALAQYVDGLHWLRGDEFKAIAGRLGVPYVSLTLSVAVFSVLIGIVTTVWVVTGG